MIPFYQTSNLSTETIFKIQDFILNPLQSIEDSEVVHIIITDTVHQWRHLSFALYWLFKPLVGTYTPIQPPRNNNKGNGLEVDALDKLHYADFSLMENTSCLVSNIIYLFRIWLLAKYSK